MRNGAYTVIQLVGTSEKSRTDAAVNAVDRRNGFHERCLAPDLRVEH